MLCISNDSIKHQSFVYPHLNDQTVLFETIQFSIRKLFSSIGSIDKTLSGATNPGQSVYESDFNEGYTAFLRAPVLLKRRHCHQIA